MNVKNLTSFVVRTDTINEYLKEISKYKPLTAQEEKDLFAAYEDATEEKKKEIKDKIILSNMRFNYAVAKRYSNGDILPDLINVGFIGMCEAFEEYDWRRDVRFYTFASYYIRRAINAYLVKENMTVRQKNYARIAPKVKKIESDYYAKTGRMPSATEVISILKSEYNIEVKDEADIYGTRVDRIDAYLGDDEDNTFENSAEFNDVTAVDNGYETKSDKDNLSYALSEAMNALTERERTIISMAYGYNHSREYKDKEIAERIGLTSERVRQLRHAAVKKMRSAYLAAENR